MNDYLKCLIRHAGLSQIFHENLRIATVAQLGNALFPDLAYTLTSQPELIADFLQTFLVTANAETLANNGNLTLFQHLVQHGIQLKCHRLVVNLTIRKLPDGNLSVKGSLMGISETFTWNRL